MEPLKQIAALPYVETERSSLVLLITTRGMGRWSIPKGWPKPGLSYPELAAREAFEEAGVAGLVSRQPISHFIYTKRQHLSWPEKASRRFMWVEPSNAATLVRGRQLADVLREFDRSTQGTA
jgi:ADP-ribose pyrophosphatase YjhB (NUDIX family)